MLNFFLSKKRFYREKYPGFDQFFNFSFVGFAVAVIDFGLTFLLKDVIHFNKYFANTAALVAAVILKFILHRFWVFKNEADLDVTKEHIRFIKFIIVSVAGIILNNFIIYLLGLTGFASDFWFYSSKLVATIAVLLWNFYMNKIWTFKKFKFL